MNAKTHNSANLGVWSLSIILLSYFNYINLGFNSFKIISTTLSIVGLYLFVDYGTDYLDFDRRLTNTNANFYYKFLSHLFYQIRHAFNISGHRSAITHSLDMILIHSGIHYFLLKYLYRFTKPFLINAVESDQLLIDLIHYVDTTLIGILIFGFWMGCMSHWFYDLLTNEGAQLTILLPDFKVNLIFAVATFNTGSNWELMVRKVSVKSGIFLAVIAGLQLFTETITPLPTSEFRDLSLLSKFLSLFKVLRYPLGIILIIMLVLKLINVVIKKITK